MGAHLLEHRRVDPRQDAGQEVRAHAGDLALGNPGEKLLDLREDLRGALVGRSPEAKPNVLEPPAGKQGRLTIPAR